MNKGIENRICQNCKKDFTIEPEDFKFYEKMKVPPPTLCPECRYIRRLLDRNEYNLYKRKCDATGGDVISIYRDDVLFPVYKQEYWKSDKFDATEYGRDFDLSRPFFEQFEELRSVVPHIAMVNSNSINSEYTNQSQDNKDCYMLVTSGNCEKCMYGSWHESSFFCSDCYMVQKSEYCYECINLTKCSHCAWSQDCSDCVNMYFSNDCKGCTDCFGCVSIRNKSNYWFNKQLTKEEYKKKFNSFIWDRQSIHDAKKKSGLIRLKFPFKYYHGSRAENSTGDYMENMERSRLLFNCRDHKDTAYMQDAWLQTEDCRDCTEIDKGQLSYEIQGVDSPYKTIVARSCTSTITNSCYCDMCFGVQDCFGCFGLKQKQYCILNKQYIKEEYVKLKEKIIEHMRKTKEWGEYFPVRFSPFAYNESMAMDYFPLTREEVTQKGYLWYDRPVRDYKTTIFSKDLPRTLEETSNNIVDETIQCSMQLSEKDTENYSLCATAFKITPLELSLYKILNIPIPEKCFPCRRQDRFKLRNQRKLWHRKCMKPDCSNEFETSYAPDRPEIIYCERCYNQEVY